MLTVLEGDETFVFLWKKKNVMMTFLLLHVYRAVSYSTHPVRLLAGYTDGPNSQRAASCSPPLQHKDVAKGYALLN